MQSSECVMHGSFGVQMRGEAKHEMVTTEVGDGELSDRQVDA